MFFEDLKIVITFLILAVLSAIIRFKTFTNLCIDAVLGFVTGYSLFFALDYFVLSGQVRAGIAGIVIIYSRPLYDAINKIIINKLEQWLDRNIEK